MQKYSRYHKYHLKRIHLYLQNTYLNLFDRYRILNEGPKKLNMEHKKEIEYLIKRSKWTHWAIALTTVSALFVCVLIAMIFIATEVSFNFDQLITILFILAMTFLVFGLLSFLKEVDLSKGVIKF